MNLSKREHDVLLYIAQGLVEKEIAKKLKLRSSTVHSYITSMKRKMNALTRAHAVAIYYEEYPKWKFKRKIRCKLKE